MEVHINPELEKKLNDLAAQTGRGTDALAAVRGRLDSRYDALKSGSAKPIDGAEAFTRLREKSKHGRDSTA